jgi:hypothetical protein
MDRAELPRVLGLAGLRTCGVSAAVARNEVRRGRWRRLARGVVLTRPDCPQRADWAWVGLLVAGGSAAVSGWDALHTYGLASSDPPSDSVLILCTRGGCRDIGRAHLRRVTGPLTMRTASIDDELLPLAHLATPARAIADLAPWCRQGQIRSLVTSAVQRNLCTPDDIATALAAAARRGSAAFRRSVEDLHDGARSVAEIHAARRLRDADVPPFELNVPLIDSRGYVVAVADVLWRSLRAILEIDSREFHFAESDWQQTMVRHNRLTACGFALTHYPPSRIFEATWGEDVTRWLRARARELGVPYRVDPRPLRGGAPLHLSDPPTYP